MPYVSIEIGKQLEDSLKSRIYAALAEAITVIPGKTPQNTMVNIKDGQSFYMDGKAQECAFCEVRLYKEAPFDRKELLVEKYSDILSDMAGIELRRMYFNIIELDNWGSAGEFR